MTLYTIDEEHSSQFYEIALPPDFADDDIQIENRSDHPVTIIFTTFTRVSRVIEQEVEQ